MKLPREKNIYWPSLVKTFILTPKSLAWGFISKLDQKWSKYWWYQQLKDLQNVFWLFLITRFAIFLITYYGLTMFKPGAGVFPDNLWLEGFTRWDGEHYVNLALNGYFTGGTPWFPVYPFLIRIFSYLFGDPYFAGIIVSNLSFLAALIYLYKLVKLKYGEESSWRTILYLAVFPTTFFFCSVLSESTFLMLSVMAFYYAEKGKWCWSGFCGFLCVLTRSMGILITLPLLLIYLARKKFDLKQIKIDILPLLLIPLGVLVFMAILIYSKQNPLSFIGAQKAWGRFFAFPWWDLLRAFNELVSYNLSMFLAGEYPVSLLVNFSLTVIFIVLSLLSFKYVDLNYGLYAFLMLIFPLSNPSSKFMLYSNLRFILVIFPVFILLGKWGKNKIIDSIIMVFSLLFLSLFSIWNGLGGWVS